MNALDTVRAENPHVLARLLDDLLWTVQRGAFGPEGRRQLGAPTVPVGFMRGGPPASDRRPARPAGR